MPNGTHAAPADATSDPPPALKPAALADASAVAPRLPDHGPLADHDFARLVRQPLKVGHANQRVLATSKISAGNLNTFLRSLRTLVTHATSAILSFCRKPQDVWIELEFNRSTFYRYVQCAGALGQLKTGPAGTRGVVKFDMPRSGGTLHDADEQSRSAGRFVTPTPTNSPAQRDASPDDADEQSRSAGRFVTPTPTNSPAQRDASRTLLSKDLSDHHQLDDLASQKQIRKLCALDRGAGLEPAEEGYRHLTRTAAWDLIAERERGKKATACALNDDVGCGRCHRCRPDQPRCMEWDRDGRRCVLLAKHGNHHDVGKRRRVR